MIFPGEPQDVCDAALTITRVEMTLVFRLPYVLFSGGNEEGTKTFSRSQGFLIPCDDESFHLSMRPEAVNYSWKGKMCPWRLTEIVMVQYPLQVIGSSDIEQQGAYIEHHWLPPPRA